MIPIDKNDLKLIADKEYMNKEWSKFYKLLLVFSETEELSMTALIPFMIQILCNTVYASSEDISIKGICNAIKQTYKNIEKMEGVK